ncbi:hypothetical protein AAG570_013838 [Ranatra chinensis]|uniref:Tektin n=1 Tax=Ranatra chinensis TaxID=642074 RepID=A0ABD0YE08_9HEMI
MEKPVPRVALADWHGKMWELRQTCDTRRRDAFNLRNESRQLRNETESKTTWDTYHNNARLTDRLIEVTKWRELLDNYRQLIDKEIADMKKEKEETEAEIEFLGLSFTVVNECLTQRDQRSGADLCTDEAEIEIKHELRMLESLKELLTAKCQSAWEQLNSLDEIKFRIMQDLEDKDETIAIDQANLGMDKHGANISYKPNTLRSSSNGISYECWLKHCRHLKMRADTELSSSQKLRESMYVPRERARNDLKAQNDMTNFALRKRIYEAQRIKNELEWQRLNMMGDIDKFHKEVDRLENALLNKTNALKLAETRTENRLYRPGNECCRDEVSFGICKEIDQLKQTRQQLQDKLDQAKSTYNALEDQLMVIDRELAGKNYSLSTDLRCLDLRNRLVQGHRAPPNTETDRNIVLTRMQDEIPPE